MPLTSITAQGAAESGGGRYRLDAELARGGMGVVYRAFDESLGRFVALKRPTADAMKKKAALALFQREFLTLSRLRHPRIIEAYEYGYDDGVPYYTMELLDGRDLRALAPLPFREASRYLRDVASSLALLHARRQLHRDVSPSNVRLTGDGRAKLIDFGAMTTFGTTGDIVGTPPSIAPEMLRRAALDQRSDLYGLGATAYWALTGRHAYPARSLADLEDLWSKGAAARPSAHVHGIPSALDDLVLSLLHMDPLARPSSAAEVIERLNTIAHLESEDEAAQSYLVSPGVIGRAETSKRLGRRLVRLQHHGKGAAVLIIGHTGVGRTRLLEELGLDAQLSGLRVVAVDAESCPETYGVAGALVEGVFRCVPRAATEAAADAPLALALQFPSFGRVRSRHSHVPSDPAELRVALQTALHDWMVAVARKQRLLLLVDNLQQTDEASLALLTSLSHEASKKPLFLALTLRSGEAPVAPSAIAALEQSVEAMMLEPLQREQTHELVQALFGDVPNVGRLAAWMHDTSGGNPLSCIEFARDIVSKQIATYHDGSWVLPQSLPEARLPRGLEDAIGARLARLDPAARDLAASLSIAEGTIDRARFAALSRDMDSEKAEELRQRLVGAGVLMEVEGDHRFVQKHVRELLRRSLPAQRRRDLHRRLAELLTPHLADPKVALRAGFHLMEAGDEAKGADLVAAAAPALVHSRVSEALPLIEAALSIYEREGRPPVECLALREALVSAAYTSDRAFAVKYGEDTIRLLRHYAGLALADRLRDVLGHRLSFLVGVGVATLRHVLAPRRRKGPSVAAAFIQFFTCITSIAGVAAFCVDVETSRRQVRYLEWASTQPKGSVAKGVYELCHRLMLMTEGREGDARTLFRRTLAELRDPGSLLGLPDAIRHRLLGGIIQALGSLSLQDGENALEYARQLDEIGDDYHAAAAAQVRMLHHLERGEAQKARRYREIVELDAIRRGSPWQLEICAIYFPAYALSADSAGLKQVAEQLSRISDWSPALPLYEACCRSSYHLAHGESREALDAARQVALRVAPRTLRGWGLLWATYAAALNEAGEHGEAADICTRALEHTTTDDRRCVAMYLELERQLALAEAALGRTDAANVRLQTLLDEHADGQNPLMLGLLHAARAKVALVAGNAAGFERHHAEAARWFRQTENPALVARIERLRSEGVHLASTTTAAGCPAAGDVGSTVETLLGDCTTPAERALRALQLVANDGKATGGYLHAFTQSGFHLVAQLDSGDPPSEVEEALRAMITEISEHAEETNAEEDVTVSGVVEEQPQREYRSFLLTSVVGGKNVPIGVISIRPAPNSVAYVDPSTLQAVVRSLHDDLAKLVGAPAAAPGRQ